MKPITRGQKRTKKQKRRDAAYLRGRNQRDAEERELDARMERFAAAVRARKEYGEL